MPLTWNAILTVAKNHQICHKTVRRRLEECPDVRTMSINDKIFILAEDVVRFDLKKRIGQRIKPDAS